MLALGIILAVLLLIALLRFGIIVIYDDEGFRLWAKVGFVKISVLDDNKDKKPKKKKKKKEKEKKFNPKEMMPGGLSEFLDMLRAVKNALSRLKRRLLIKRLRLYYMSAGENPANTAIQYGAANAVFETIIPILENNFRIRKSDLRATVDFNSTKQKIYAEIAVSIAVWEVFYIVFALFPILTAAFKRKPDSKTGSKLDNESDRKDGQENGESPDK